MRGVGTLTAMDSPWATVSGLSKDDAGKLKLDKDGHGADPFTLSYSRKTRHRQVGDAKIPKLSTFMRRANPSLRRTGSASFHPGVHRDSHPRRFESVTAMGEEAKNAKRDVRGPCSSHWRFKARFATCLNILRRIIC